MKSDQKKSRRRFKERYEENRPLYTVRMVMIVLFAAMAAWFVWLEVFGRTKILSNPNNNRYESSSSDIHRGSIESIDGAGLAVTVDNEDGTMTRVYPYGEMTTAVTGYTAMGKTGLEASMNRTLMTSSVGWLKSLQKDITEQRTIGDTVVTTLDCDLQTHCWNLLQGHTGSIIVMNPTTGAILAMVTNPTFDANTVAENWDALVSEDNDSAQMINRATQGLYPPGSTFKIVTAIEYMKENPDTYQNFTYNCTGSITLEDGTVVHCTAAHGEQNMIQAMGHSCNCAFITMGLTLDRAKYRDLILKLGFGQSLISDLPSSVSSTTINSQTDDFEMAMTAFGQGNTMETPLQNILITSMIANGGTMMKPYIVDHITNADGKVTSTTSPRAMNTILNADEVSWLNECLKEVVNNGTTPQAASSAVQVAGKSGTAQYEEDFNNMHAWFTAYAPAENPQIAVVVMLEKGGSGSMDAGPLVSDIVTYYFTR